MKTLITAHSGADHTAENSLEYLQHVFSSSADTAEVDVRMHAGELVLGHDAVGDETNESEGTGTVTHSITPHPSATLTPSPQGEGGVTDGTVPLTHYYKQACEVCVDAGIRVLNVPKEIVDATFCEILKEYGLMASVWTVDDVHEAQRLARLPQVLGITTRDVVGVSHLCNPSYSNRSCSVNT